MLKQLIDGILVVKGAEEAAVRRGLTRIKGIEVIPIPMGVKALSEYLERVQLKQQKVLVLGLGGSINPNYGVGDVVIYKSCTYKLLKQDSDRSLTQLIQAQLSGSLVEGLTCDRIIAKAIAKQEMRANTGADVVDTESFLILQKFTQVAIVRVISDSYQQNLPDLNEAIDAQGNLNKTALAIAMFRQPLASVKLIHSSLTCLKILEQVTHKLFLE